MIAFQSAYRKHHSTESALLNIYNDILLNMAKGYVSALTHLDLSTAFDTIDHTILLDRLNVYYGSHELSLGWFKSHLSGRTHSVKVDNTLPHPAMLQYGVPTAPSLVQFFVLSTPTQSAQSFTLFDAKFCFTNHINSVIKSCFISFRDDRIISFLSIDTSVVIANALVSSCLDYCNSLFHSFVIP